MKKPEIIPDMFPLNIEGKTEWVKRGQYAKTTAENMTIKLKADVKRAHVEEMLEAIEKGASEMNAEAPKEMHETFKKVIGDFEDAVQHVKDLKKEEEDKKAAAEKEAKEKEEKEGKLVKDTVESTVTLADLSKTFDTGENMDRFIAKKEVSNETLLSALKAGMNMGEFSNYMIGDLVVELENRGQLSVVAKLAESMGKNYSNIYNAAKTCRNVPPEKRTKGVSYTIFAEIANAKYSDKKEEHEKKMIELVDKAASGAIKTSAEARLLKNEAAGKKPPTPKLPEEDEKHEFIIVDISQELVQTTVGFPKELFENGAIVIDKKTGKQFQSFRAKPENRWADLPIYKKPAPPAAASAAAPAKGGKGGKKK